MDFKNLKTQTDGPIATVHFDRPDKANALNYEHLREIKQVCEQYQENDQVRVIIFTGNGNHFSSGADLSDPGLEYQVPLVQRRRRMRAGEQAIQAILDLDQITIAAWHIYSKVNLQQQLPTPVLFLSYNLVMQKHYSGVL